MALLYLLAAWRATGGPELFAATVDHGLRPEAADEAEFVGRICASLGVSHQVLRWQGWDGKGNLPDQARRARYRLLADWARELGLSQVVLGHTMDDQAETFLMRMARGSGVDGLSGMAATRSEGGILFRRPLLYARRAALRTFLRSQQVAWVEDPSNEDAAFERVMARQALATLEPLGITPEGLVATADRLRLAREALAGAAQELARKVVTLQGGDVLIERAAFEQAPLETRARLFAHALGWISSADYRPRFAPLSEAMRLAEEGKRSTLQGCLIMPRKRGYHLTREWSAVAGVMTEASGIWDRRWRAKGPSNQGFSLRALGRDGIAQLPDGLGNDVPQAALMAQPSVWQGAHLVAAPLAGWANGWQVLPTRAPEEFFTLLIVH